MLQVVDSDHSSSLFDELSILIDSSRSSLLLVDLSDLQDVLQTIERDLNDLVVHRLEKVTHWLDAALRDEVSDLIRFLKPTGGCV